MVQLDDATRDEQELATIVVDAELAPTRRMPEVPTSRSAGDAMRRALEDDLFELHCQPLLDLRTNDVVQYELLHPHARPTTAV